MVYKVILARLSRADLQSIGHYIAQHDSLAAQRTVEKLVDVVSSLRQVPLQGRTVRTKPGVRRIVHGNYLIYYRVEEAPPVIRILRFWHGARDPKTLRF